jgi:hypothetical protein
MSRFAAFVFSGLTCATGAAHAQETLVLLRSGVWSDNLNGHDEVNTVSPRVPVYGLSVSGRLPFTGQGITSFTGVAGQSSDLSTQHSDRVSGELTYTGNTNEQFGFALGYRYELAEDKFTGITPASVKSQLHSLRLGFVGTTPIFDDESQRIVSAFYFAGGSQRTDATNLATPDTTNLFFGPEVVVAYVLTINEKYVLDLRYRAAFYASDLGEASNAQTESGVFLSLGYRFGSGS